MGLLDWLFGRKPVPTPTPVKPIEQSDLATLLDLHNAFRLSNGKPRCIRNPVLDSAAQGWAYWMAQQSKLVHEAKASTLTSRAENAGFVPWRNLAENILEGAATPEAAMSAWRNSMPHRLNMLGLYSSIGFGIAYDSNGTPFWCVDFGTLFSPPTLAMANEPLFADAIQRVTLSGPLRA